MHAPHPIYRSLVRFYPRAFRLRYSEDLVQSFTDLVIDRGTRTAWTRTGIDLLVTIPRYRLESIMTEQHSSTTLSIVISLLAGAGLVSVMVGLYPGLVFLVAAVGLAIAQRSTLARAIRTPDSNRRRRRLRIGSGLGAVSVACYVAFVQLIGDSWTIRETILNLIGVPAMFGGIFYLIAGLLTPRSAGSQGAQPAA